MALTPEQIEKIDEQEPTPIQAWTPVCLFTIP
jgi:hypothetical protein